MCYEPVLGWMCILFYHVVLTVSSFLCNCPITCAQRSPLIDLCYEEAVHILSEVKGRRVKKRSIVEPI